MQHTGSKLSTKSHGVSLKNKTAQLRQIKPLLDVDFSLKAFSKSFDAINHIVQHNEDVPEAQLKNLTDGMTIFAENLNQNIASLQAKLKTFSNKKEPDKSTRKHITKVLMQRKQLQAQLAGMCLVRTHLAEILSIGKDITSDVVVHALESSNITPASTLNETLKYLTDFVKTKNESLQQHLDALLEFESKLPIHAPCVHEALRATKAAALKFKNNHLKHLESDLIQLQAKIARKSAQETFETEIARINGIKADTKTQASAISDLIGPTTEAGQVAVAALQTQIDKMQAFLETVRSTDPNDGHNTIRDDINRIIRELTEQKETINSTVAQTISGLRTAAEARQANDAKLTTEIQQRAAAIETIGAQLGTASEAIRTAIDSAKDHDSANVLDKKKLEAERQRKTDLKNGEEGFVARLTAQEQALTTLKGTPGASPTVISAAAAAIESIKTIRQDQLAGLDTALSELDTAIGVRDAAEQDLRSKQEMAQTAVAGIPQLTEEIAGALAGRLVQASDNLAESKAKTAELRGLMTRIQGDQGAIAKANSTLATCILEGGAPPADLVAALNDSVMQARGTISTLERGALAGLIGAVTSREEAEKQQALANTNTARDIQQQIDGLGIQSINSDIETNLELCVRHISACRTDTVRQDLLTPAGQVAGFISREQETLSTRRKLLRSLLTKAEGISRAERVSVEAALRDALASVDAADQALVSLNGKQGELAALSQAQARAEDALHDAQGVIDVIVAGIRGEIEQRAVLTTVTDLQTRIDATQAFVDRITAKSATCRSEYEAKVGADSFRWVTDSFNKAFGGIAAAQADLETQLAQLRTKLEQQQTKDNAISAGITTVNAAVATSQKVAEDIGKANSVTGAITAWEAADAAFARNRAAMEALKEEAANNTALDGTVERNLGEAEAVLGAAVASTKAALDTRKQQLRSERIAGLETRLGALKTELERLLSSNDLKLKGLCDQITTVLEVVQGDITSLRAAKDEVFDEAANKINGKLENVQALEHEKAQNIHKALELLNDELTKPDLPQGSDIRIAATEFMVAAQKKLWGVESVASLDTLEPNVLGITAIKDHVIAVEDLLKQVVELANYCDSLNLPDGITKPRPEQLRRELLGSMHDGVSNHRVLEATRSDLGVLKEVRDIIGKVGEIQQEIEKRKLQIQGPQLSVEQILEQSTKIAELERNLSQHLTSLNTIGTRLGERTDAKSILDTAKQYAERVRSNHLVHLDADVKKLKISVATQHTAEKVHNVVSRICDVKTIGVAVARELMTDIESIEAEAKVDLNTIRKFAEEVSLNKRLADVCGILIAAAEELQSKTNASLEKLAKIRCQVLTKDINKANPSERYCNDVVELRK